MLHLSFRSVSSLALLSILASLAAGAAAQTERLAVSRPPVLADKPIVHLDPPHHYLLADKPAIPVSVGDGIVQGEQRAARFDPPKAQLEVGLPDEKEQPSSLDSARRGPQAIPLPVPASASAERADVAGPRPLTEPPLVVAPFLSMALSSDRELIVLVEGFGPFYCAVLLSDRPDLMHSFVALPPLLATGSIVFTGKASFGSFVDQLIVPKDVDFAIYGQALTWSEAGLQSSPIAVVEPAQ